jgi:hypothetical protein
MIENALSDHTLYIGMIKEEAARIVKLSPSWDKVYTSIDESGNKTERWVLIAGPYRPSAKGKGYTLYFNNDKLVKIDTWPPGHPPLDK